MMLYIACGYWVRYMHNVFSTHMGDHRSAGKMLLPVWYISMWCMSVELEINVSVIPVCIYSSKLKCCWVVIHLRV